MFSHLFATARDEKLFRKLQSEKNCLGFLANDELLPALLTERFLNYALIVFINCLGLFQFNLATIRRLRTVQS